MNFEGAEDKEKVRRDLFQIENISRKGDLFFLFHPFADESLYFWCCGMSFAVKEWKNGKIVVMEHF